METVSIAKSYGGLQGVYRHDSDACGATMTFAVYLPPQAEAGLMPVLWYLSGLTCTYQNVMDKGEYRSTAARHGVAIVCPDTSPRGPGIPDEPDNWQMGSGAGFYLDATPLPWSANYRMATYLSEELPRVVAANFPIDLSRQGVFGHSMGRHGALTLALRNAGRFRSVSAFAPIVQPSTAGWSRPAFEKYLGPDPRSWRPNDATLLIEDGHRVSEILFDQGTADGFLQEGLRPWLLEQAWREAGIALTLNMREGYDHSYFFISTFMADHIAWHAVRVGP